jgi:pimeloyl-ACP methyl ester carboxylesterase
LHGDKDSIVPITLGDQLYKLITAPKRFVRFPGAGHNELASYGALETARQFLNEPVRP